MQVISENGGGLQKMGLSLLLGMAYIGVEIGVRCSRNPQIESAYMENTGRTAAVSTFVYFLVFRRQGRSRSPTCLQGDIRTAGRLRQR